MAADANYKFEYYEKYLVEADQVEKQINECPVCGSKLLLSHLPDYKNLLVQETARCLDCGNSNRKVIHIIN